MSAADGDQDQDWAVASCVPLHDVSFFEPQEPTMVAAMFRETKVLPMPTTAMHIVTANAAILPKAIYCPQTAGFVVDLAGRSTFSNVLDCFWKESTPQDIWTLLGWEVIADQGQIHFRPASPLSKPLSSVQVRMAVDAFRRLAQKLTSTDGVPTRVTWSSQKLWRGKLGIGISKEALEMLMEAASSMFVGPKYFALVPTVSGVACPDAVCLQVARFRNGIWH